MVRNKTKVIFEACHSMDNPARGRGHGGRPPLGGRRGGGRPPLGGRRGGLGEREPERQPVARRRGGGGGRRLCGTCNDSSRNRRRILGYSRFLLAANNVRVYLEV
ncbi:hypothetical protein HID58_042156 [Brassica napus]|uniref:Uncharacterized protein n=1 Tax=Brassica napus TaxID=3708 RepID=A0ABQ8BD44_BRANA|nr:hypothetical protein HID58_042156 [Brassica napus]